MEFIVELSKLLLQFFELRVEFVEINLNLPAAFPNKNDLTIAEDKSNLMLPVVSNKAADIELDLGHSVDPDKGIQTLLFSAGDFAQYLLAAPVGVCIFGVSH